MRARLNDILSPKRIADSMLQHAVEHIHNVRRNGEDASSKEFWYAAELIELAYNVYDSVYGKPWLLRLNENSNRAYATTGRLLRKFKKDFTR
jgi:hypothetical protein